VLGVDLSSGQLPLAGRRRNRAGCPSVKHGRADSQAGGSAVGRYVLSGPACVAAAGDRPRTRAAVRDA